MRSRLIIGVLVVTVLAVVPASAMATDANGNHATYDWFVGSGLAVGPDVAMAPNGDTIALTGSGSFTAGPGKNASGGGSYGLNGGPLTHTWTVTGVLGFVSYGEGIPQGLPGAFGGQLKLRVSLDNGTDGVLTVTCELGSPPAGGEEGITLVLGRGGEFTKTVSGQTVFTS